MAVSALCLFLVGLQCVIVVFPSHAHSHSLIVASTSRKVQPVAILASSSNKRKKKTDKSNAHMNLEEFCSAISLDHSCISLDIFNCA